MTQQTKTGFQTIVSNQPAPAEAGDFYGVNPRASVIGGAGQFVAPALGLAVGQFAWFDTALSRVSQSYIAGLVLGMVRRANQAVITTFLAPFTYLVNPGFPVTGLSQGDFWVRFAGGATPGQLVYADSATGAAIAANAGSSPTSESATASAGFTGTGTLVNASAVLTIAAVTNGILSVGDTVTGVQIPANTTILNQLTGTPGGIGTYTMSNPASATVAAPEAITSTSTVLNVTAVASGTIEPGDTISGTGVTAGTTIVSQIGGTSGGIGTYRISVAQNFAPTTVGAPAILTPWIVNSVAAAGALAKISTWG